MTKCHLYQEVRDFLMEIALSHYISQAWPHAEYTFELSHECTAMHADVSFRQGVFEELVLDGVLAKCKVGCIQHHQQTALAPSGASACAPQSLNKSPTNCALT